MRFFLVALAIFLLPMQASARDFDSWLQDLRGEAVQRGISPALVAKALPDTLEPNDKIIRLDGKQPENTITFETYKKNIVTPQRLQEGRSRMRQHESLLKQIGKEYGVEPQYIVALWAIETNFGKHTGGFETIPALVTLAYNGRRSAFFRDELFKALRIIDQGHIDLHEMKGSWAGAMGQCQFMPTSFEKFAQDYNRDGRRDIWNTEADVFASAAQYLSASGWKAGEPWGQLVRLPKDFDNSLMGRKIKKSVQFWRDAGVQLANGNALPETEVPGSIIQPGGEGYKAYIIYGNYNILMQWNTSLYFATAVGFLADGLKG